ncbi:MAG: hypothetical protein ACRCVJ_17145 [Clostridium sp.]|uniref:hypothetical protein n=1 Tax=Clostridium sp. TaxID=1506 RepID=UPI003F3F14C8
MNNRILWNGKIHIISDEKFFALLTDKEYQLYCALKSISYHNNRGKHYLFSDQISFKSLSEELSLTAGKNRNGEDSVMSRQTIAKTFKSLEEKKVLKKDILFENKEGYFIITEKDYKFTSINNELLKCLTKTLKGQVIKAYIYIKANFEYNKLNGKEYTLFTREKLAVAINELNKNGDIEKRQLTNITAYTTILYNLGLLNIGIMTTKKLDGTYSSCYRVDGVSDKLKRIPKK